MQRLPRIAPWILLALVVALFAVFGHERQIQIVPPVSAAIASAQGQGYPDQGPDPATVNEAPGYPGAQPSGQSYTTEAPPPPGQEYDDSNYAEQATAQASEPPPPLPDYQQPAPPADGYIWMPGYWAWGSAGYYWVPGAWVEPPYVGALWTPSYWAFYSGRYLFYPGHWGAHIGFYGGINYGFGYFGLGYEGGYWNAGHFFYNSVYNNINTRIVHNVYSYHANTRAMSNRPGNNRMVVNRSQGSPRPSFRGGRGGVQARPQPSEAAAWREPSAPRMSTQVQHERTYSSNSGQFANTNHGRPANPAINRPIPADHNVRPSVPNQGRGGQQSGQPQHHR